jgi:hypothetical protein
MDACVGTFVWGKHFAAAKAANQGAEVNVMPTNVVVDKSNNVLMSAELNGVADFGGGPVGTPLKVGELLVKFDASGGIVWSGIAGNSYPGASPRGLAGDSAGNSIVAGSFGGMAFFGGVTLVSAGDQDAFVAKLDPFGMTLWAKNFGDAKYQTADSVQVDAAGNVVVCGHFYGSVDLGGGPLTSVGGSDIFLAKFAPDGTALWSKRFGGAADDAASMVIDAMGNLVLSVPLEGSIDFGGGPLTTAAFDYDVVVVKLDSSGNHLWSRRFGSPGNEYGSATVDPAGNVILSMIDNNDGNGPVDVDLGGGPIAKFGLLAKFDGAGNHIWSEGFDASGQVVADTAGNLVMTGACRGNVDFGSGALACPPGADVFVAKFDANGKCTWSRRFGDAQNAQVGWGVGILEGTGDIALLGQFRGALDFGGGPIPTATTLDDTFLVRLRLP